MAFIQSQSSLFCQQRYWSASLWGKALCRNRKTYCLRTDHTKLTKILKPLGFRVPKSSSQWKQTVVCSLTKFAETFMLFYAFLLAGGGVAGYVRVKSTASITSGVVSGLVLAYAWYEKSIPVALAVSLVLVVVSVIRYTKSKKFMPAGLLGLVSTCACLIFTLALRA